MDDAMILPCGHSFGGGGIQHVIRMVSSYDTIFYFQDSDRIFSVLGKVWKVP